MSEKNRELRRLEKLYGVVSMWEKRIQFAAYYGELNSGTPAAFRFYKENKGLGRYFSKEISMKTGEPLYRFWSDKVGEVLVADIERKSKLDETTV